MQPHPRCILDDSRHEHRRYGSHEVSGCLVFDCSFIGDAPSGLVAISCIGRSPQSTINLSSDLTFFELLECLRILLPDHPELLHRRVKLFEGFVGINALDARPYLFCTQALEFLLQQSDVGVVKRRSGDIISGRIQRGIEEVPAKILTKTVNTTLLRRHFTRMKGGV